jgi:Cu-Zn family superoxide dismutase
MPRSTPIRRLCGAAAIGIAAMVALPATGLAEDAAADMSESDTRSVALMTADGAEAGTATFRQAHHGVIIALDLANLTPGPHGLHLHETGACTPDFKAAGGHYNPQDAEHGFDTAGGHHVGDLPNIIVADDGTARGDVFVPKVSLTGSDDDHNPNSLSDADGSAIMVHAGADDYRDMASSGDRVACGVIMPPQG